MDKQPKLHFKHITALMEVSKFLSTFVKCYIFVDLCIYVPLLYFNCTPYITILTMFVNSIIIATLYIIRLILFMVKMHLMKLDMESMQNLSIEIEDVLKVMENENKEINEEKGE